MTSVPMIAGWRCSCGESFEDAHQAFLHRDGTDFHQVNPSVSRMTGIEKQELQTEIQLATKRR
jgi:hypothetical protein